jgi:flagellar hook-associated protein 2
VVGSISSLGLGSQLQLQDILDQLREVDEQVIKTRTSQVTRLEDQLEEFTVVKNKLLTMKSHALDLTLNSSFLGRTVSNSNEDVLRVTAIDGAKVQSTSITVERLAAKSSLQLTSGVASKDAVLFEADTTIGYQLGDTEVTLDVTAGTTLAALVELINDDKANPGITASVIDSGEAENAYFLVLQANKTGEDHRISNITGLTMTELQGAAPGSLNAKIIVDGIPYQRQTNSITDVLAGITLELKNTGSASVSIAPDTSAVSKAITGLVEAYNDVIQEINTNVAYDKETREFGTLAGTTIRSLVFDLLALMNTTVEADAEGKITSMYNVGMVFNRDGTLSLDNDVLTAALANNIEGVRAFFLGDEARKIEGFADLVNERFRALTSASGLFETEKNAAQDRIDSVKLQIEIETERLDKKYERMAQQFVELDRYMNQLSSISSFLTGQFASLNQVLNSKGRR